MPMIGPRNAIPGMISAMRELVRVPARSAPKVAAKLDRRINEMFQRGENPYRRPWAPLKPSTIRRKRKYPNPTQILVRAKRLWPGTRFLTRPGSGVALVVGPKGEYAQEGDSRRNRPPREIAPAYGLPAHWRKDVDDVVAADMRAAARMRR